MLPPVAARVAICVLVWKKWIKQGCPAYSRPIWGDLAKMAFNYAGRECRAECRAAKNGGKPGMDGRIEMCAG